MKFFMRETVEKYNMLSCGDRIMCGLSGGADSVAMFRAFLQLSEKFGVSVCAAHMNHMLRGAESERDAEFVKRLCDKFGVELYYEVVDVGALSEKSGESVELAARNARYEFFGRGLKSCKADKVATAHNADDNLETLIMHLARGCALNGLGGIPPVRGNIIRPLIETTRKQVVDYLEGIGQGYVEDSTNSERLYTRNRIRLDVLPLIKSLNPSASEAAAKTAQMLREDEQYLSAMAEEIASKAVADNGMVAVNTEFLNRLAPSLRRRVVLQLARRAVNLTNYYLEFEHICDIIELACTYSPSARLNMPGGLEVARRYDLLVFNVVQQKKRPESVILWPGQTVRFGEYEISCSLCDAAANGKCGKTKFFLPVGEVTVRMRREGDSIRLCGRSEKTIKKLFIDEKVPRDERDMVPVFESDGKVLAVGGFGVDESVLLTDKKHIMWVTIRRIPI